MCRLNEQRTAQGSSCPNGSQHTASRISRYVKLRFANRAEPVRPLGGLRHAAAGNFWTIFHGYKLDSRPVRIPVPTTHHHPQHSHPLHSSIPSELNHGGCKLVYARDILASIPKAPVVKSSSIWSTHVADN